MASSLANTSNGSFCEGNSLIDYNGVDLPDIYIEIEAPSIKEDLKRVFPKEKMDECEMILLEDLCDYINTENPDWIINDSHIHFLVSVLENREKFGANQRNFILKILQLLVLSFDFVLTLKNDGKHSFMSYLKGLSLLAERCEAIDRMELENVVKVLCNACFTKIGAFYVCSISSWTHDFNVNADSNSIITSNILSNLLLQHNDPSLFSICSNMLWHLSLQRIPQEMAFTLSIPILQCLKEKKSEKDYTCCLIALKSFVNISAEVQALCRIDLDLEPFEKISPQMKKVCQEIEAGVKKDLPQGYIKNFK